MSNTDAQVATNAAGGTAAGAPGAPPQQRPSGWQMFQSVATRMLIMYFFMQAMSYFRTKPPSTQNPSTPGADPMKSGELPGNMFAALQPFDMYVFLSENETFTQFDDPNALKWHLSNFEYGNWYSGPNNDAIYTHLSNIELTPSMQNNGSIYLHVYFTESGRSPNPNDKETYSKRRTFSTFKRLNKYMKKTYKSTKNLLTGSTDKDEDYQLKAKENIVEIISHWHPNITINIVDDHTPWVQGSVPPPLNEYIEFDKATGKYYPVLFINDYWNLNSDYMPLNESLSHVNLSMTFYHLQLWKWQLYLSQSMRSQNWYANLMQEDASDEDQDTIKRTLLETNPYLLILTVAVTIVHNIFEFLAFKNDIQFWRNKKSLEGLSVNSVLFGCVTSFIVLLYVLDNDTNTIVRISVCIGLLIDLWKVPKVVTFNIDYTNKILGLIPRVKIIHKTTYVVSKTNEYDRLAFKFLSWLLFPLVFGYSIYSLIYQEHKGWYSWVISTVYGFLLTFGFIMMTPQLFINYKLKSVAHLPWRMMTYKALNTFIDDIFAFVIKMPTMYRLGCFRDDIIFFIYLYQRYKYPVDKKRTNEYGYSEEQQAEQQNDTSNNTQEAVEGVATNGETNHVKSD